MYTEADKMVVHLCVGLKHSSLPQLIILLPYIFQSLKLSLLDCISMPILSNALWCDMQAFSSLHMKYPVFTTCLSNGVTNTLAPRQPLCICSPIYRLLALLPTSTKEVTCITRCNLQSSCLRICKEALTLHSQFAWIMPALGRVPEYNRVQQLMWTSACHHI